MNKVILMGRLTRSPEVRYSQGAEASELHSSGSESQSARRTSGAVARYTLAVNRRFKRKDEPEADFIPCVALGKRGEFAEKYFRKGQLVGVIGRLQVRSWEDKEGKKHWTTEVIIEEQHFAESKNSQAAAPKEGGQAPADGFYPIDESVEDDDLPF